MKSNWALVATIVIVVATVGAIMTGFLGGTITGPPSFEIASAAYHPLKNPGNYDVLPTARPADWVKPIGGRGYEIHIEGTFRNANLSDLQCLWTPVDRDHKPLGPSRMVRPAEALPGLQIDQISRYEFTFSLHVPSGFRFGYIGERLEFTLLDDDSDIERRILIFPRTGNP